MSKAENGESPKLKVTDKRIYKGKSVKDVLSDSAEHPAEPERHEKEADREEEAPPSKEAGTRDARGGSEGSEEAGVPPDEVNFSAFVLSLSSSALLHFGSVEDPFTKKKQKNLPLAKQTIDILGILHEKTKGNLSKEEAELLDNLLYSLRMRYMQEVKQ